MSAAHTPGPWTMRTVPTSVGICHKVGPFPGKRPEDKPRHACLYADYPSRGNPSDDELEANARLIAAAPELLDALRDALVFAENQEDVCDGPDGEQRPNAAMQLATTLRAAIAKATGEAA